MHVDQVASQAVAWRRQLHADERALPVGIETFTNAALRLLGTGAEAERPLE